MAGNSLRAQLTAWGGRGQGSRPTFPGVEIAAVAGPARPVEVPGALTLSPGAEGELVGRVAAPVDRARGYLPRSRVFGTEAWTLHEPSNDSRAISVTPLVPGTKYEVQVAALGGSDDQSAFGDSAVGRAP